jgi:hypothetical protein
MEKYRLPSGHGGWEYCPVTRVEIEKKMSKATVRALAGLLHDLTDVELSALLESSNRPGLKLFLSSCTKISLRVDYSFPLSDMFAKQGLAPENPVKPVSSRVIEFDKIFFAKDYMPGNEVPLKGIAVLAKLKGNTKRRLLDAYCLQTLYNNQQQIPSVWKKLNGIYFFGTIFVSRDGRRWVAYLKWIRESWEWGATCLEHDWFGYECAAYIEEKNDECS